MTGRNSDFQSLKDDDDVYNELREFLSTLNLQNVEMALELLIESGHDELQNLKKMNRIDLTTLSNINKSGVSGGGGSSSSKSSSSSSSSGIHSHSSSSPYISRKDFKKLQSGIEKIIEIEKRENKKLAQQLKEEIKKRERRSQLNYGKLFISSGLSAYEYMKGHRLKI